ANVDNNSVVVVDISNTISEEARWNREYVSVIEGFIPVGWYPTAGGGESGQQDSPGRQWQRVCFASKRARRDSRSPAIAQATPVRLHRSNPGRLDIVHRAA